MTAVPDPTPSTPTPPGRRYGGADPTQRRERRRAALIAAGLDAFGTDGYANVSVKGICDLAGLTQGYFYESFTDRAALLVAVYDDCVDFVRAATVDAAAEIAGAAPGHRTPREAVVLSVFQRSPGRRSARSCPASPTIPGARV